MAVQLRAKLRYADLANTSDDGKRYELLDGVLVVTPSPAVVHQVVLGHLHVPLREYFQIERGGMVLVGPADVVLADNDVLVPDLVVVTDRRLLSERAVEGPPTIVVEILSPSNARYDRVQKAARYALFGVPHYWIVDPKAHVIECYRNVHGQFVEVVRASDGPFQHPDFEGLSFDVSGLWK